MTQEMKEWYDVAVTDLCVGKCLLCKGNLIDSYSNYMVDMDGHFIIIKNVPCHKCSQCGEVSYSGAVVSEIEKIVEKLKDVLTEVAIVDFAA